MTFPSPKPSISVAWLALAVLVAGCGPGVEYYAPEPDPYYHRVLAPGRVPPADEGESAALAALGELPVNVEQQFGAWRVLAGEPYVAASGLVCRRVLQTASAGDAESLPRLACRDEAEWFFAPDVFAASAEEGAPP